MFILDLFGDLGEESVYGWIPSRATVLARDDIAPSLSWKMTPASCRICTVGKLDVAGLVKVIVGN
jgi:hypothetical protein